MIELFKKFHKKKRKDEYTKRCVDCNFRGCSTYSPVCYTCGSTHSNFIPIDREEINTYLKLGERE